MEAGTRSDSYGPVFTAMKRAVGVGPDPRIATRCEGLCIALEVLVIAFPVTAV
jgi:hypothetical protein